MSHTERFLYFRSEWYDFLKLLPIGGTYTYECIRTGTRNRGNHALMEMGGSFSFFLFWFCPTAVFLGREIERLPKSEGLSEALGVP